MPEKSDVSHRTSSDYVSVRRSLGPLYTVVYATDDVGRTGAGLGRGKLQQVNDIESKL